LKDYNDQRRLNVQEIVGDPGRSIIVDRILLTGAARFTAFVSLSCLAMESVLIPSIIVDVYVSGQDLTRGFVLTIQGPK
jgi:hypothetical protein